MIPQAQRLPSRTKLFAAVFLQAPLFSLKASRNNLPYSRFAFVVGKRIDKKAVVRNRLRRVLREIVLQNMHKDQRGWDMLFVVKRTFLALPREQIQLQVLQVLSGLLKK